MACVPASMRALWFLCFQPALYGGSSRALVPHSRFGVAWRHGTCQTRNRRTKGQFHCYNIIIILIIVVDKNQLLSNCTKIGKINREPLILLLGQLMLKTANPLTLCPTRLPKLGNILSRIWCDDEKCSFSVFKASVKNNVTAYIINPLYLS